MFFSPLSFWKRVLPAFIDQWGKISWATEWWKCLCLQHWHDPLWPLAIVLSLWWLPCHLSSFPAFNKKFSPSLCFSSLLHFGLVLCFSLNDKSPTIPPTYLPHIILCPSILVCVVLYFFSSSVPSLCLSSLISSFLQCIPPHLRWHHSHHAVAVPRWTEGWVRFPAVQELHVSQVCLAIAYYSFTSLF